MYLPAAFAEHDLAALDALASAYPFATLIAAGTPPQVSHLPLLYTRAGDRIELRGHFARANPQSRCEGPVTVVLHGPHAYVSPAWYPDKDTAARVPTWNYAVAHLGGTLQLFDDEDALAALVSELSDLHERTTGSDWRFEPGNPAHASQLRGIIGFRIKVDRVELKFKLSQNHPLANRQSVAARLATSSEQSAREVGALMQARMAAPTVED